MSRYQQEQIQDATSTCQDVTNPSEDVTIACHISNTLSKANGQSRLHFIRAPNLSEALQACTIQHSLKLY